jgi:glucose/arabinose dehydrogenase
VIDGDTVEIRIAGSLVGIGFIGIEAPMGNTDCGRQAASKLSSLVAGGMYAEEDPETAFDERGRRMYYAYMRGRASIGLQLVGDGFVHATGRGREAAQLRAAENRARAERRGCLWDGNSQNSSQAADIVPVSEAASERKRKTTENQSASEPSSGLAAEATEPAAAVAAGFVVESVAAGLVQPTAFAWLPDGRILVTQKHGEVRLIKNGALQAANVIDLSARVNDYWDRGLIGVAVDPAFATNSYIYLLYTYEDNPATWNLTKTGRLARYTMVGDTASLASELTILGKTTGSSCDAFPTGTDCIPSESPSHSVGALKFASDGTLFVTTGDGAHFNNVDERALRAQDRNSLSGKILRITTSGQGVSSNPFVANAGGNLNANQSKVWAYGVRNSFRFNLHPTAGVPYLGEVGWNTWEEVNVGLPGANLGWPCYEGPAIQSGYQPLAVCQSLYNAGSGAVKQALWPYSHSGTGAAVTGGAFYTGTEYPAQYR